MQASLQDVKDLIAAQSRTLYVTHHNSPTQTVVGGLQTDLAEFAGTLKAQGYKSTPLRVPGALHSPLVAGAQAPLRAALERETLRPPTRLFYSNVTCGQVARAEEFVNDLVAQLAELRATLRRIPQRPADPPDTGRPATCCS